MKIKVKVIDDTTTCIHEETHTDKYDFGHADPITLRIIRMLKFATTVVLGELLGVAN